MECDPIERCLGFLFLLFALFTGSFLAACEFPFFEALIIQRTNWSKLNIESFLISCFIHFVVIFGFGLWGLIKTWREGYWD